jgi:hypothetical protein
VAWQRAGARLYVTVRGPMNSLAPTAGVRCRVLSTARATAVRATAGLGAPVRVCVSQQEGEDVRIDLDEPTAFFSQFPEMKESKVPGILDRDLVKHLIEFASCG